MKFKLNIGIEELLRLIKQLPANQLAKLKVGINESKIKNVETHSSFQKLLLNGPIMNGEQKGVFPKIHDRINSWRTK